MGPARPRTVALLEPPTRTALQVTRHAAEALSSLGHEAPVLSFQEGRLGRRLKLPGVAEGERAMLRRKLLSWLERVEPDLIFVCKGEYVSVDTIGWVRRRMKVPWALWFIDDPLHLDKSTSLSPHYDYLFTTDAASADSHRRAGAPRVEVLPYACHPPLHSPQALEPGEREALSSQVVFVGTINTAHRRDVLEALASFDLRVWGGTTERYIDPEGREMEGKLHLSEALLERLSGRWAWDEEVPKIYAASDVVLNVQHPDRLNMRLFEAPACGAFLLTDGRDYVGEFFEPEKEVALYDGLEDVAEKVAYWLSRPEERRAIAEAGRRRAHRDHTYQRRMEVVLKTCFSADAD